MDAYGTGSGAKRRRNQEDDALGGQAAGFGTRGRARPWTWFTLADARAAAAGVEQQQCTGHPV